MAIPIIYFIILLMNVFQVHGNYNNMVDGSSLRIIAIVESTEDAQVILK